MDTGWVCNICRRTFGIKGEIGSHASRVLKGELSFHTTTITPTVVIYDNNFTVNVDSDVLFPAPLHPTTALASSLCSDAYKFSMTFNNNKAPLFPSNPVLFPCLPSCLGVDRIRSNTWRLLQWLPRRRNHTTSISASYRRKVTVPLSFLYVVTSRTQLHFFPNVRTAAAHWYAKRHGSGQSSTKLVAWAIALATSVAHLHFSGHCSHNAT